MDANFNAETFQFLLGNWAKQKHPINEEKASMPRDEDNVVGVRIRPLLPQEAEGGHTMGVFKRTNTIADLHVMSMSWKRRYEFNSSEYYVDRVYGPTEDTEALYDDLVKPLVDHAYAGGVGTFFAYGQTGSGKTFTVSALENLVARDLLAGRNGPTKQVFVSIFELGGALNVAYDLLNYRKTISILEDSFGETRLNGATEERVIWTQDLVNLIDKASQLRATAKTEKNDQSSRSHAICRLTISDPDMPAAADGVLYLIDLAGAEVGSDSANHSAELMKDCRMINKSLSMLKECIRGRALSGHGPEKIYVPFRQSALTKTLKHVFDQEAGRVCKTSVIACINPSYLDASASKSTLRYAEMLRVPIPKPKGVEYDPKNPSTWTNAEARKWITEVFGATRVNAALVAPYHTGSQLVLMDKREFVERCLKTPGAPEDTAYVVHSKLWRMHVDSARGPGAAGADDAANSSSSSAPPEGARGTPFKERLRPGMVVRYRRGADQEREEEFAMVICPAAIVDNGDGRFCGLGGDGGRGIDMGRGVLCSVVERAVLKNSFLVNVWQHVVVSVDEMEAEAVLQYDAATRYYFLDV